MLRFLTFLTGDRYIALKKFGPASQRKVIATSTGLILVTILWFLNGFNLGLNAFEMDQTEALGLAIGMSTIVFMIDRMVLLCINGSKALVIGRVTLALLMAILGGIGLDLYVMRTEIQQTMAQIHEERRTVELNSSQARYAADLLNAENALTNTEIALANAEADWASEMDGTSGSKHYGVGSVAKAKERILIDRKSRLTAAQLDLEQLKDRLLKEQRQKVAKLDREFLTNGLFARIHAMHRYMTADRLVLISYVFLTMFFVLIELSPLLIKFGFPKTAYERAIEVEDQLERGKLDMIAASHERHNAYVSRLSLSEHNSLHRLQEISRAYNGMS